MIGDVNASGDTDGRAWSERRRVATGPRDAPCQRPWREIPPDLDAITAWTAEQERARDAYYAATAPPTAYDERVARAMAQRRYRARKAAQR